MNLKELMKYSKDKRLEFIDLKFTDIPGLDIQDIQNLFDHPSLTITIIASRSCKKSDVNILVAKLW